MLVFNAGFLPDQYSMLLFHALARLDIESLVLVSPENPIVSLGYFQDLDGVDLDYCANNGISIMRRELGGGTTLLDRNQIFYQLILKKDNPLLPGSIDQLYQKFSQPAIDTYADLGVATKFKPINDIITDEGRKIAGEGGGDIEECTVFVGGILLDFDFELMTHVLKVPDEKFRDKMYKTMEENMTTLKRELGQIPDREKVIDLLIKNFSKVVGPLTPSEVPNDAWDVARVLGQDFKTEEFLHRNSRKQSQLQIGAGVSMKQGMYKAPGGLIQATSVIRDGYIESLQLNGDFTFYPKNSLPLLAESLQGVLFNPEAVKQQIDKMFSELDLEMPGVNPQDICQAIFSETK
ncbi:MAG TPA: lipoate protein ligase C-terminal domain-containing protein [Syntrophomonadaceae bacterium]|nr:lipoate protein ligase C-terminal domain-containing protein [Syntrophomonadaceae bacterium]